EDRGLFFRISDFGFGISGRWPGRSAGDAGHGNWVTAVARKATSGGTASPEATELLHIDRIQPRGVVVGKINANSEGLVWRSCVFGRNRPDNRLTRSALGDPSRCFR